MTGFFLRAAIVALGLWLATQVFTGLQFDGPGTLLAAAVLLGIVNAIVRPIAVVLTLPLTLLSLATCLAMSPSFGTKKYSVDASSTFLFCVVSGWLCS